MVSGESSPKAKLSDAAVISIRAARANGVSVKELAAQHGITGGQMSRVSRGLSWKLRGVA